MVSVEAREGEGNPKTRFTRRTGSPSLFFDWKYARAFSFERRAQGDSGFVSRAACLLVAEQRVQVISESDMTANIGGVQEIGAVRPAYRDGYLHPRILQFQGDFCLNDSHSSAPAQEDLCILGQGDRGSRD